MVHRTWILAFALVLFCTPVDAVPSRDDSGTKKEEPDASSIRLESTQPGDRSYDASRTLVEDLPPGLSEEDELPPGLRKQDELPPGLRDDTDGRAHEWRKRIATQGRFLRSI